ncbi:MAG: hypothetical protein ACYS8W_05490 [Planctomycetota bacterium]|jgi:hypothetical protein
MRIRKGFVAFCDIIGFSPYMREKAEQGKALEVVKQLNMLRHSLKIESVYSVVSANRDTGVRVDKEYVEWLTISDSIFLHTEVSTDEKMSLSYSYNFFQTIGSLIARALDIGFGIRGTVAFGEYEVDFQNGIIVGIPILDAVESERAQEWIGVACHSSCRDYEYFDGYITEREHFAIPYSVPVKPESSCQFEYAVNWLWSGLSEPEKLLEKQIDECKKDSHSQKWRQTLDFYKWAQGFLDEIDGV